MHLTLSTSPDFSFSGTLTAHGWRRLLPFTWDEETGALERIERLTDGRVVLLTIREASANALTVSVSEAADEAEIIETVRRMLQLDLPVDRFHQFCQDHPKLCQVPAKRQGRLLVSPTLWEDCCKVIATTNTTWTQTRAMTSRIVNAHGSPWPQDPARHAFPIPAQIAAVPFEEFCTTAKLGYRNAAVHGLAVDICAGTTELEALAATTLPTTELWKKLLALRGIGPYAASCLMIYLGRYERVNVDSWARTLVKQEIGRPVTDKDVHDFFEPYGEWQALAYHFYPWKAEEPAS